MNSGERYNHLNKFLKEKFGERTLKICVDGGFTCPNRDGKLGYGGCIYCSEKGSGELINPINSISEQVRYYFTTYKAKRANKFIVYFQNFTNTYDSLDNLKAKYNAALIDDRIVGISIGTRPDCINEDIVKLLSSYSSKYYVCVELGLQTSSDKLGEILNRKYTSKQFTEAVQLLNKYSIDVITHIMVGLPNETDEDIKNAVDFINKHNLQGVKIHCTYIVKNTVLEYMYQKGTYTPLKLEEYMEKLIYVITHLNPNFIIHRISGDAPKNILVAPDWNIHKLWILNNIDKILCEKDLWQGKFFSLTLHS